MKVLVKWRLSDGRLGDGCIHYNYGKLSKNPPASPWRPQRTKGLNGLLQMLARTCLISALMPRSLNLMADLNILHMEQRRANNY